MPGADTVHASAVVVGDRGVLVRGASGSGKSSLVLALLAAFGERAVLVADDRVVLAAVAGRLLASAPPAIAGMMEIRGLGIVRRPHISPAVIDLVVDLLPLADCPRLPEDADAAATLRGVSVPRLVCPVGSPEAATRVAAVLDPRTPPAKALSH